MQFIVGLGNPGSEYHLTRHNAGFLCVDGCVETLGLHWESHSRSNSLIAKKGELVFLKPQTYMNDSGEAVSRAVRYFELSPKLEAVYVVFDDLDLPLGSYKLQFGKGPKVHNGVNSVCQHLGSDQFWHLRIGIDSRSGERTKPGSVYVLEPFSTTEYAQLQETLKRATDELLTHASKQLEEGRSNR